MLAILQQDAGSVTTPDARESGLDARNLFLRTARRQPVERVLFLEEAIRQEVLERWYGEGLSLRVTVDNYRDFFSLDSYDYIPMWLEAGAGALSSEEDFTRLEHRYRNEPQDFRGAGFWRQKASEYAGRQTPLGITGWRGFMLPLFTHRREWDSLQDVLLGLHDFPRQVKSALELVADCYIESLNLAFQHMDFDFGVISEPIASPSGPVISPRMFAEFVLPSYRRIIDMFHEHGVDLVVFKSISNIAPLLPMVVEAGIDGIWVTQTSDAIDYVELRESYPHLLLIGGLDATVLTQDEDTIRNEVTAKVPRLLAGGRYLPALDDNPRENVPYGNYVFYRRLLREVCMDAG